MNKCSGIILAGGKSSRMGRDKAMVKVDGLEMVLAVINQLDLESDELLLCTNHDAHRQFNKKIVEDKYKNCGPLAGIHAGLSASKYNTTD